MSANWLPRFLEAIQAERDAALNTLSAYSRDLNDFAAFLQERGQDFDTAMRADIEAYLADQADRGMARSTRARRLSAIRQLYRFAYLEGWRSDDPAAQLKGPKKARSLPDSLTEAEVDRLLAAAEAMAARPPSGLRWVCLMQLLYATGLRVSELVALPVAAVRGDPRMILVRGKGGRERMVPLSPRPARAGRMAGGARRGGGRGGEGGKAAVAASLPGAGAQGAPDPRGVLPRDQGPRAGGGDRRGPRLAARAAPCLRHASAGERRRPAGDPDPARPCEHRHHRDLHPCAAGAAARAGAGKASAGRCARGRPLKGAGSRRITDRIVIQRGSSLRWTLPVRLRPFLI
jgi:integrase/recombinase XerD